MPPDQFYPGINTYCYPCWYYQKASINIGFSSSIPGYMAGTIPALIVDRQISFTVTFEKYSPDTLNKIELYIFHRNGSTPIPVGTDTNGTDGWAISVDSGFISSLYTAVLIGTAYFEGHNLETDGDMTLLFITISSSYIPDPLPAPPLPTAPSSFNCNPNATPEPTPYLTPESTSGPTGIPTVTPAPTVTPDPNTTLFPTQAPIGTAEPYISPVPTLVSTGCTCNSKCDSRTAITVPFSNDDAGEYCWESASLGTSINSWNLDILNINGANYPNTYVTSSTIPPIDGKYYIYYYGSYSYSHFEIVQ